MLGSSNFVRTIGGRALRAVLQRPAACTWSCSARAARATGSSTRCSTALERDDARDRQGLRPLAKVGLERYAASTVLSGRRERLSARVAVFGAGYVGLVTGACFAELGHDVVVRDVVPERIERAARRRGADLRARAGGAARAERRAADASRSTSPRRSTDAEFLYVASARRRPTPATPISPRVWTVIDELPALDRRCRRRDEEHRAGRHRARRSATASTSAGSSRSATPRIPSSPPRARRSRDFLQPDRIVVGAFDDADGDAVAALHAGIDAPVVRCDVASAEMIKLAANAVLMTRISFINEIANVCEATGADVVARRRGHRPRPADRPELPARRDRLRRQLLPEGLARAEAARRQLGLPLPAPERGDRGERAAEAARDRQAPAAPRAAARQDASRCSGSRSSRTPTTCARRRASCSPAGCSPRARTCAPGIRSPTARDAATASRSRRRRRRPLAAPTRP